MNNELCILTSIEHNNIHSINVTISVLNRSKNTCSIRIVLLHYSDTAGPLFILGIALPPILFVILGGLAIIFFGCLHDWKKSPKW